MPAGMRAVKIIGAILCFVSIFVGIIAANIEGGVVTTISILGFSAGFVAFIAGRLFDRA